MRLNGDLLSEERSQTHKKNEAQDEEPHDLEWRLRIGRRYYGSENPRAEIGREKAMAGTGEREKEC